MAQSPSVDRKGSKCGIFTTLHNTQNFAIKHNFFLLLLEFSTFTDEQRSLLMKYFNEYGMTSTHRRNADVIARCAAEIGTTIPKVKVLHNKCDPSCFILPHM